MERERLQILKLSIIEFLHVAESAVVIVVKRLEEFGIVPNADIMTVIVDWILLKIYLSMLGDKNELLRNYR